MPETKVNRERLLYQLESIQCGLAQREIIEQSTCFVFRDDRVWTFNDEICCSSDCEVKSEGAIPAKALLELLRKHPDDLLTVSNSNGQLTIGGKKKSTEFRMEREVFLQVDAVERPEKWRKLADDFAEGIGMVHECASRDETEKLAVYVHITPTFVEAADRRQVARYHLKTGCKEEFLVRHDSIKHIVAQGMTEIAEGEGWTHFRNPSGMVLSCRRVFGEYMDLDPCFDMQGKPILFPKNLIEAAERAGIFSSENLKNDRVIVRLKPGKVQVLGEGISGRHREMHDVKYKGPPLEFRIAPKMLGDIVKKYAKASICESRLKVEGDDGKWAYVAYLSPVKERDEE